MRALLGYLLAVSLLLEGGYLSLQWLSSPSEVRTNHRTAQSRIARASREVGGRSEAEAASTPAENRSHGRSDTQTTGSDRTSKAPDTSAAEADTNKTGVTEDSATVGGEQTTPSGNCGPIGLTAQGEPVFPMQCRELVERDRGPAASQDPVPPDSMSGPAVDGGHAAEPARTVERPSGRKARAEAEGLSPSGRARPHNENSERAAIAEKKGERRSVQSRSRNEGQWFSPLAFR
jgi:hypothetical protein